MRVRDIMSSPVFTLRVDKQLIIARQIMEWAKVRHVPVVDRDNHVVGMVTQRDLLRYSISGLESDVPDAQRVSELSRIPIQRIMRREVATVSPDAPVQAAAELMHNRKIGCLPVVEDRLLIGIVSEYDLLAIVAGLPEIPDRSNAFPKS